jgi:hypothetical protein
MVTAIWATRSLVRFVAESKDFLFFKPPRLPIEWILGVFALE